MCDYGVAVALVGDDRQGHRVDRPMRRTDEHRAMVVLSGHIAYISVLLDDVFDAMSFSEYVIENEVCTLAKTEDAHAVGGLHTRQLELNADKSVITVDFHAFALRVEDAGFLRCVLALAHIAFFVRSGNDRDRVHSVLGQTGKHLYDADLGE